MYVLLKDFVKFQHLVLCTLVEVCQEARVAWIKCVIFSRYIRKRTHQSTIRVYKILTSYIRSLRSTYHLNETSNRTRQTRILGAAVHHVGGTTCSKKSSC